MAIALAKGYLYYGFIDNQATFIYLQWYSDTKMPTQSQD